MPDTKVHLTETQEGIAISCHFASDGVLQIESNLSDEDTKAALPLLFPAWVMNKLRNANH